MPKAHCYGSSGAEPVQARAAMHDAATAAPPALRRRRRKESPTSPPPIGPLRGCDDHVALLRGRSQRLELRRDRSFHHLTPLRGRRTRRSEICPPPDPKGVTVMPRLSTRSRSRRHTGPDFMAEHLQATQAPQQVRHRHAIRLSRTRRVSELSSDRTRNVGPQTIEKE